MLFDEHYQPKHADGTDGKELPVFSANGGFGQYTHTYHNGVRGEEAACGNSPGLLQAHHSLPCPLTHVHLAYRHAPCAL